MMLLSLSASADVTKEQVSDSTNVIKDTVQLNEVVVQGTQVINKSDRKLFMPSDEQREKAHSGTELVRMMQLPDVKVNPISHAISMASAGKLKLSINGRPVESKDIQALDPTTIQRVEYHDSPSMRHGDVDLVLDFIVKNPQSGGRLSAMEQSVFTHGFAWHQDIDLAVNHKRSEFQFQWWNEHVQDFKTWRDNTETYNLSDGSSFTRTETGMPTPFNSDYASCNLIYNYNNPDKDLLSIHLSVSGTWNDNTILKGVLHNTLDNSDVLTHDESDDKSVSPKLDVYYQRNLSKDRLLIFNFVGKYNPSKSYRHYMESTYEDETEGKKLYDITNDIRSRSFSLLAEADYEQSWKGKRLTVGGRYSGSWSRSEYLDYNSIQRLQNHSGDFFAEFWWRVLPKLDITAGVGGSLKHYELKDLSNTTNWMWQPKLNLRYRLAEAHTLRLNYLGKGMVPAISELSPVRQQVDGYQASVGNPDLQPYMTHNFSFRYEYTYKSFYGQLMANYAIALNPVAGEKYWDDDVVLSTYDNQKDYHKLSFRGMVRETVIPKWLSVTGSLTWNRMISQGNKYCHTYNQWIPEVSAEVTHWNWSLQASYQATPRTLWGEDVYMNGNNGGNFHVFALGYNYKHWQFNMVAFNPFGGGGIETSNLNKYAGYERNQHINFTNKSLVVQVTFDIDWGRKYKGGEKKLENDISSQNASAAKK